MEAANEAARRAVNSIIDASESDAPYCQVWDLQEPTLLVIRRWSDQIRYGKGLAWNGKISPWYLRLFIPVVVVWAAIERIFAWLKLGLRRLMSMS